MTTGIITLETPDIPIVSIGIPGPRSSLDATWQPTDFINLVWGTESAESSNIIEITATLEDLAGDAFINGNVFVELIVSDAANSYEPSNTAIFQAAASPLGTLLAGTGTANSVWRTNASGTFKIAVYDETAGARYIWTKSGGHEQLFVRAKDGIKQITFT